MQQLHIVGITTDQTGLVFSMRRGTKSGGYYVVADAKLLEKIQEVQRLRDGRDSGAGVETEAPSGADAALPVVLASGPAPRRVSSLSPREIQARLRAGGAVSEIAAAAGVDTEWILRFADPIRAEQARVVERAQKLTFNKPRLGLSTEPLEVSVRLNLAERGVAVPADIFAAGWTAFNLHGTSWAVCFSYTSRSRRQTAQWEVDLRSGDLIARNRLASDLAYVEPGRRRRRMEPLEMPAPEKVQDRAERGPTASSAGGKRAVAARKTSPRPKTATTGKPAAQRAGGRSSPLKKASSARKGSPRKTAVTAKKASPRKKAVQARKTSPRNTAVSAKKTSPLKKSSPLNKSAPATRGAGRESSARTRRTAKKPVSEKPGRQDPAVVPAAPTLPERPTHLARPPSPMNQTNRAVTLPGRLVGAPSLRPSASFRPRPQPSPPPRPRPEVRREPEPAPSPEFEPAPVPEPPGPENADPRPEAAPQPELRQGGGRSRRGGRKIAPRERPAVVILSTPAVRRLDSEKPAASETTVPGA